MRNALLFFIGFGSMLAIYLGYQILRGVFG